MASKPHLDADWLREQYHDRGLTMEEMADMADTSTGSIWSAMKTRDIERRSQSEVNSNREPPDEPYTDEEWLREQYHGERKTTTEIGEECDVSGKTINEWMNKLGVERRDQSMAQIGAPKKVHNEEWLREQYVEERRSMRDIGEEVGMTASGVKNWIDKFGIESRDSHEHYLTQPAAHFWGQKGYEHVSARYHTETDSTTIHQLVAIAEGANPAKVFSNGRYHVHHKNGVKWDNRPENLELQSSKTHAVHHHHEDRHGIPDEYASDSDPVEVLFALRQKVNDWRESGNSGLEMAADELDGTLRGL